MHRTSQPQKKLRFAQVAKKGCALDQCEACSREEGYRRNPKPPSSYERLAAALQAAVNLRCEVMEIREVDIGGPPLAKHAAPNDG